MAFAFDGACELVIPERIFASGSALYKIVVLSGYVNTALQVVDGASGETLDVAINSNSWELLTSVRIESKYLRPGKVLRFITPERIMQRVYTGPTDFTLPKYGGTVRGGVHVWNWTVPY